MATPEGKVKDWVRDQLKVLLPGARLYKPLGGAFGKAGEPDIQVTYVGCKGVIEAKATINDDPTPLQYKRLREYHAAGALCMVLRDKDFGRLQLFAKLMKERAECLKTIIGQQNQA